MFLSQKGTGAGHSRNVGSCFTNAAAIPFRRAQLCRSAQIADDHSGSSNPEIFTQQVESCPIVDNEEQWIEKYRAVMSHRKEPRRLLKFVLGAGMLATLSLGYAVYLFSLASLRREMQDLQELNARYRVQHHGHLNRLSYELWRARLQGL